MNGHSDSSRTSAEGSRHFPWPTPKEKLCEHVPLSSWRRVRGGLDWLALAGHRRGHPMKRREFIAASAALLGLPRRPLRRGHVVGVAFSPLMWWSPPFREPGFRGCENPAGLIGENLL